MASLEYILSRIESPIQFNFFFLNKYVIFVFLSFHIYKLYFKLLVAKFLFLRKNNKLLMNWVNFKINKFIKFISILKNTFLFERSKITFYSNYLLKLIDIFRFFHDQNGFYIFNFKHILISLKNKLRFRLNFFMSLLF